MKMLTCVMADGTKWGVPVRMVALNRAAEFAPEFGGDIERSLKEDTLPLFEEDEFEIEDWAVNNMNWPDFDGHQVKVEDAVAVDFESDRLHGDKAVEDVVS